MGLDLVGMSPAEFSQIVTLAFQLVGAGSEVKVEPYCCQLPKHVRGRATAVITVAQGNDKWLVSYDPKLLKGGSRGWAVETAFHEACHVGLFAFGTNKEEIKEAEDRVEDCAEKWMTWRYSANGRKWIYDRR